MNALQNQIQLIKGSFGPPGVKGELGDTGLPGPMVSHRFNTCTAVHFQISQLFSHRFLKKHDNTNTSIVVWRNPNKMHDAPLWYGLIKWLF